MSHIMYQASAQTFTHNLKNLSSILKTASKDAKARGIDPSVLLNSRLAPDMLPLTRQVQIATDHAKGACARLAGVDSPTFKDTETTFADLDARIKRTLAFIRSLKTAQFEGCENRDITLTIPSGTLSFDGLNYLNGWALPNFYFHNTTAFSILRHNGVTIGKGDFIGRVPNMVGTGKIAKMMGLKPAPKAAKKR